MQSDCLEKLEWQNAVLEFRLRKQNTKVGSRMWRHVANFGCKMCLTTAMSGSGALKRTERNLQKGTLCLVRVNLLSASSQNGPFYGHRTVGFDRRTSTRRWWWWAVQLSKALEWASRKVTGVVIGCSPFVPRSATQQLKAQKLGGYICMAAKLWR